MQSLALLNHRTLWVFVHLGAITAIVMAIFYGYGWWLLTSYLISRVWLIGGMSIGLHRYFSHKTFTTTPLKHKLICFLSMMAAQGSPIAWAMVHRHHHKYTDKDHDLHAPKDGIFHAAVTWALGNPKTWVKEDNLKFTVTDLAKDKVIAFTDKWYYVFWYSLIAISFLIDWKIAIFLVLAPPGLGYLLDMLSINVLFHVPWTPFGYRNFDINEKSRNFKWFLWLGLSEGLHNNHHAQPWKANVAVKKGEFDISGWIIDKWFAKEYVGDVKVN